MANGYDTRKTAEEAPAFTPDDIYPYFAEELANVLDASIGRKPHSEIWVGISDGPVADPVQLAWVTDSYGNPALEGVKLSGPWVNARSQNKPQHAVDSFISELGKEILRSERDLIKGIKGAMRFSGGMKVANALTGGAAVMASLLNNQTTFAGIIGSCCIAGITFSHATKTAQMASARLTTIQTADTAQGTKAFLRGEDSPMKTCKRVFAALAIGVFAFTGYSAGLQAHGVSEGLNSKISSTTQDNAPEKPAVRSQRPTTPTVQPLGLNGIGAR